MCYNKVTHILLLRVLLRVATCSAFCGKFPFFCFFSAFSHKNRVDGKNSYTIKIFIIEEFLSGLPPLPLFTESFRFFYYFSTCFLLSRLFLLFWIEDFRLLTYSSRRKIVRCFSINRDH